ncbi:succinic semialdehyde dehydrogenase [Galbitalea sp. SE-J8]|uniref:succinic semialdehyde dehydrogenase n=1 Tax=Galbitalea sp. SE-J8 TaxID=3054952 RepID=UPI00259C866D|nr:succinic semialdehyde dehydrogenase [Galbitalea sp. SE-J8]MDM4764229.1 succinic semialdehyde dehydrogenase [Galbitalea sp. SE-J8]
MAGQVTVPGPIDRALSDELIADLVSSGAGPVSVIAPFTGAELHTFRASTAQDVTDAAAAARVAALAWQQAGAAHRRRVLLRAHDLLLERRELLLDVLQTETGKTRGQAFEEVFQGATVTRYYALTAERVLREHGRRAGIPVVISTRVGTRPKGVVGVVTPWNYPLSLALMDVVPALAAGNGVVQKADDQGVLTVLAARRAFIEAGVPAALWSVVAGDGETIGNAVVDTADYVCFTGSTATGTRVATRAAGRLIGASMELGGKNPMIVLDDVDPEKAAADATYACFSSAGQLCVSIERIYLVAGVADAFVATFTRRVRSLALGAAYDFSTDVGSLATAAQLERVTAHVDDAIARGATVLAGGHARPDLGPYFFEPTVLTGVTSEMACDRNETFGPVVAIHVVDDAEEAIARANDSDFGLNASVFSGSVRRARAVANALDAGSVNINEGYRATFSSVDAPMGGMKQSGVGRRNGPEGILRFVEQRTVAASTGLLTLPRTGREFGRMAAVMVTLLRTLRATHLK